MGGSFLSLGGWTALNQLLSVGIWLIALIILPRYSAGPSSAFPFYGVAEKKKRKGKKKRYFCVCIACACWNPAIAAQSSTRNISHTRIKKMTAYCGQNMNLKPLCPCQGQLSCFPWWEGMMGALQSLPGVGRGRNPSWGSMWRAGMLVKAGATATLRHTPFPFWTGRNHCGQGLPSRVSLCRSLEQADRPELGRWASGLALISSG